MRKRFGRLVILTVLVMTLVFGMVTPAFARTIKGSGTYYVGQQFQLYKITSGGRKKLKGKWKSSKKKVATVNKKGLVTCKKKGKCKLTLKKKGVKYVFTLRVKK